MSSFKRKVKTAEADPASSNTTTSTTNTFQEAVAPISGWKPWIHTGLGVISSGNRQLDELMGGGIPLGSIMLNLTENYSNYGQTLLLYNLAEGISHAHDNLVIAGSVNDAEDLLLRIPTNLNLEKEDPSLKTVEIRKKLKGDDEANKELDEAADAEEAASSSTVNSAANDWGLKIAWQYQKYLTKSQAESKKSSLKTEKLPFCCSYDLSRRMHEKLLQNNMEVYLSNDLEGEEEALSVRLEKILKKIQLFISTSVQRKAQTVCRIFLSSFHEIINSLERQLTVTNYEDDLHTIGRFLLRLKRMIRNKRVSVMISLNPTMMKAGDNLVLEQAVDTVLCVESFAGKAHVVPYEFREYLGFFIIKKLQQVGMLAPYQPSRGTRFGVKRDRRKLHIEPLHLPPEESRAFGSSCSDNKPIEATVSKNFEHIGSVEKKAAASHSHDHSHGHLEHGVEKMSLRYETNTALNAPPATSTTPASSTSSTSADDSTPVAPKSSLASSLAAARANRQAAAAAAAGKSPGFAPVSISRNVPNKPSATNQSIDF